MFKTEFSVIIIRKTAPLGMSVCLRYFYHLYSYFWSEINSYELCFDFKPYVVSKFLLFLGTLVKSREVSNFSFSWSLSCRSSLSRRCFRTRASTLSFIFVSMSTSWFLFFIWKKGSAHKSSVSVSLEGTGSGTVCPACAPLFSVSYAYLRMP